MLGAVHEMFLASFVVDIAVQLSKLAENTNLAVDFASCDGQMIVELEDGAMRSPDTQFAHETYHYPVIIAEISDSQSTKNLTSLAKQYIAQSSGSIELVIGFKTDSEKSMKATISTWRPHFIEQNSGEVRLEIKQELTADVSDYILDLSFLNQ